LPHGANLGCQQGSVDPLKPAGGVAVYYPRHPHLVDVTHPDAGHTVRPDDLRCRLYGPRERLAELGVVAVARSLDGEVFGLTVRSRNVGSVIGAGLKSLAGGKLKGMTKNLQGSR
jgi:hypothetical protein